jgi:hypothetical protein
MSRLLAVLPALFTAATAVPAAPVPQRGASETFMVKIPGLAFLGPDGREIERLDPYAAVGALSRDGRWLACVEFDDAPPRGKLVIRPRGMAGDPVTIPLVWGEPGRSGCQPAWTADGRLLIGENRPGANGAIETSYRVYELATKKLTELKLPAGHWVREWTPDGKRFLIEYLAGATSPRIGWLNADGTGKLEFLTPDGEVSYGPRLSPEGRRVLYQAVTKAPAGKPAEVRLYAMDLVTKRRTVVDEPGETHGYCWSPDSSRVAYTWQRSRGDWSEVPERETLLITCDPDGGNRKTVTSRKYVVPENSSGRSAAVFFFDVLDWR